MTPVALTSTAGYFHLTERLSQHARILGREDDAEYYGRVAETIKERFNKTFLDNDMGVYDGNSQTAQALPLFLRLVPEAVKQKVLHQLLLAIERADYHLTTGFLGTMPLINFLSEEGYTDIVYRMITQESGSGWLYMVKNRDSTLGENLHPRGYGTRHHPFGACIGSWFYKYLAGINPDASAPGCGRETARPLL